ncbi:MAG TPA: hypothetical protein VHB77_13880, partial [Planctomycetaceae bacterium]|nr:hypothetical protein [Planctomycetaceae bacterium]
MFRRAWRWAAWGCALLVGTASLALAGEPTNRELLPTEATVVLEVARPAGVASHPLVREVVPLLYTSEGYRQALAAPPAVQTRDVLEALQARWNVDLLEGFDSITAGGIAASFQPGPPPRICIVATARDAPALTRFVDAAQGLVREIAARNGNNSPFEPRTDEGRAYTHIGPAFFAVVGKRLLLSNQEDELRRMLKAAGSGESPAINESLGAGPSARLTVDLRKVRELPQFAKGLELPTTNLNLLNLVGGWVDLLRRSDTAVAELRLPEDRVELSLKFP